ncbi:MAG TPA: DUF2442 domain-containing protein [Bacteroidetes bacterium]|nr:DUF2442 domain-containing protein [Bacteroidota bacterium]
MKTYHAVKKVKPIDDFQLLLTFSNGDTRLFDVKPYMKKGIFKELKDVKLFNSVHVSFDTIEWNNEADFDPEDLFLLSKKVNEKKYAVTSRTHSIATEPAMKYGRK